MFVPDLINALSMVVDLDLIGSASNNPRAQFCPKIIWKRNNTSHFPSCLNFFLFPIPQLHKKSKKKSLKPKEIQISPKKNLIH